MNVQAASSCIRRKDMDSVLNCLVTDNLSSGEFHERFLKAARERFGFDYGVAVRSPMAALDLAVECLGLARGAVVGLSALSPAWALRAIDARGLSPAWFDVEEEGGAVAVSSVEERATGCAAVYLAEPWGIMPEPALFEAIGAPVVEDVTTSLGAGIGERVAGSNGVLAILGLEHASAITAGGGALLWAASRRDGMALRNAAERLVPEELLGDMNSALGSSQVREFDRFRERRSELAELYAQSLARSRKRALVQAGEGEPARFGFVVVLESGVKDVRAYAKKKDVETAMAFEGSCAALGMVPEGSCPHAASLVNRAVAFPMHPRINKANAQRIAKVLATLP